MHLYITHALYLEIYTMLLEVIQLLPIAGYEAYVCVRFFMYKTKCAAFIWLPWDARSCLYVCLYCAKKLPDVCHIYVTFVAIAQEVCHVYVTNKLIAPGRMPHIRYMQNARRFTALFFLTYPLFGMCFKFPSLSLCTVVHLDRAEYHNNSHSQEKTRKC